MNCFMPATVLRLREMHGDDESLGMARVRHDGTDVAPCPWCHAFTLQPSETGKCVEALIRQFNGKEI
jgi:hypothetical protein